MTMAEAAVTEATEAMDPTEMSSMPATMTTVSPMASRPTMTIDWLRLFMRFCQLRNSGCSTDDDGDDDDERADEREVVDADGVDDAAERC